MKLALFHKEIITGNKLGRARGSHVLPLILLAVDERLAVFAGNKLALFDITPKEAPVLAAISSNPSFGMAIIDRGLIVALVYPSPNEPIFLGRMETHYLRFKARWYLCLEFLDTVPAIQCIVDRA